MDSFYIYIHQEDYLKLDLVMVELSKVTYIVVLTFSMMKKVGLDMLM